MTNLKQELKDVNLADKNWYAQNEFYGTDEEQKFISFIDGFIESWKKKLFGNSTITQ